MALFLFFFLVLTPALALWPIPTSLHTGSTALRLDPNFSIQVQVPSAPSDLSDAVSRTANYLKTDKLQRLVVGRGANQSAAISGSKVLKTLQLSLFPGAHVTSISSAAVADISLRDESYTLTIPSDGSVAHLQANSTLGLFRGLTTFGQLWYSLGDNTYTVEAPITIKDAPAFVRKTKCPPSYRLSHQHSFSPTEALCSIQRVISFLSMTSREPWTP